MAKLGVWTCALCLFFLATVCVAAAAGDSHSSEEQEPGLLNLGFEQIPLEKSQRGFGDSIVSWLSQSASSVSEAFWGGLQRFYLTRHAVYSAVADHITGAVNRFRSTSPEPTSIPEAPTISLKSGLTTKLFVIWRQVLQDYRATAVESPPRASCIDVANHQLHSLRKMFKSQLEASLCRFNFKRGCTHRFCKLLNHDSEAVVDKVFDILGVDQHEVVLDHVANSLACSHSVQSGNEMIREDHETRSMVSSSLEPESYSTRMLRLASSPSRLFMSFYSARPRLTVYYRRAMIFRQENEPQISLEFYVFNNGAETKARNELLPETGSLMMHSVPLLPEGFLKQEEPEKTDDSSVIKMSTGNGNGAAAAAI